MAAKKKAAATAKRPTRSSRAAKPAEEVTEFSADTPMKHPAQPEEVAPAYVFLASNAGSSFISGEILPRLGGETKAG